MMVLRKIIRYNPSLTTLNMGDYIIYDSIEKQLSELFKNAFNVDVSTHLPISYIFSNFLFNVKYTISSPLSNYHSFQSETIQLPEEFEPVATTVPSDFKPTVW